MKHLIISLICLSFCCFSHAQDTEIVVRNGKQYYQYVVQPKETIYGLSKRFHITQEELLAMNPFLSEGLKIGHVLTIPVRGEENTASQTSTASPAPTKLATTAEETQETEEDNLYQSNNEQIYTVEKRREKLIEIAHRFNIDIDTIRQLNPNIPNNLRKGSVIILPSKEVKALEEKVEKMQEEIQTSRDSIRHLLDRIQHLMAQENNNQKDEVSTALLLPFMIGDTTGISTDRYVEFYEGLLMAADTLKKTGLSIHIEAYDIGNTLYRTQYCLNNNDLRRHDFIIAAANADQLPYLSEWCKKNEVRLVLPFSSRIAETESNPYIYQVNAPQSMVNETILSLDTAKFANKNIILLRTPNELNDEKGQLFKAIRRQLIDHRIAFHELIEYEGDEYFKDSIAAHLSNQKPNLIIPCACSLAEANRLISTVGAIINFLPSAYKAEMWGYPEWIALNKSNLPVLHNLNTTIYGNYFANYNLPNVRQFQINYSLNFGKDLMNTFPCYAMMGYDVMVQFCEMASRRDIDIKALQHEFHFKQTQQESGWYNRSVYLIHYYRNQAVTSDIIQ
ncbi:MAG: LysM peptidoglycan-binding domain-containing protein [Bacteroidales bacterium]|nr:LysM peptidoglycan-binding domain-containing protein [Bacteroidales bacterium]